MKFKSIIVCLIFIFGLQIISFARNYTISGRVMDRNSRETLVSAYIVESVNHRKTISNQSGFYSITLPQGDISLTISYIGYLSKTVSLTLKGDTTLNILLAEKSENIGEITVLGNIPIHEQTLMGKTLVTTEEILKVPSFVGIADLMKAITKIPGISQGSEARSNIFVRGGDRGQNLILLDGAKLYNTGHFGAYVSLFNTDIIKHAEVYKSGFPSRFGGRLSSVIDITTRDGNREKIKGNFTVGILNSGLALNGPLSDDVTFSIGLRSTYYDLFTIKSKLDYHKNIESGSYFNYTFFDANAKLTWHASEKHKLFISLFSGNDINKTEDRYNGTYQITESDGKFNVNNHCIILGNRLTITPKFIWFNNLIYTNYKNSLNTSIEKLWSGINSKELYSSSTTIAEYNLQSRFEYYITNKHALKGGAEFSNYQFIPGISHSLYSNEGQAYLLDTIIGYSSVIYANELALYAEDEIDFGNNIYANIGVRGVMFVFNQSNYLKIEPRLSIRAMLSDNVSVKTSYTEMNQFNHVLVANYNLFEKETWIASTDQIPPQQAKQLSVGAFASIPKFKTDISLEAYYKKMNNLLEYQSPAIDDISITNLEKMIKKGGKGESYGFEFQAKHNNERFSIDAGYVLSWSYRQFSQLNNGKRYPFIYDRRHQINLLVSYILGKRYSINSNFIFASGRPFSVPTSYIKTSNPDYSYFNYYAISSKNNYRMPNYHRLDVALVKRGKTKKGRIQQFTFNIYNIYAHQNPVNVYFRAGKLYQSSIFTIMPSVSYTLEF
jgi:hypothetical protein